ncbi:MAG: phosphoenolpyruvate synthase [Candidatus Promineifilaceae bacterium]
MTQFTPLILPFTQIRAADLPLVGGKGANLGEMTHAGFPIPPGFCLTTAAFQQFIAACPEADAIYRRLEAIAPGDVEAVRRAGAWVRETLLAVEMPEAVETAVRHQWQQLGPDHAYAVRSSATAEDLPDASFAGQQDTYLNVIGQAALLDAIRRCWVSLFTDRAILYRSQNQFPHRDVQLSVVVQQMVMAEKSGILFTADPLTGHRHTLTIDASFGLGEALVSGLVTPDAYRVDKRTQTILSRDIADKQLAIFPVKEGGTRQEQLDDARRRQPVLSDDQILALAALGKQVEAHYGKPQDIEWAIANEQIYLLQARPITSLYPIDGLASPDNSLHIYFSMGHQQNMTRAMSPLSLSSFPLLLPIPRTNRFESDLIRFSGGRLFADLTRPLRHPLLRRVAFGLTAQFDALAPEMLRAAMQRPEFEGAHDIHFSFSALRFLAGVVRRVLSAVWRRDLTGFVARTNALIDDFMAEQARQLTAPPAGRAQIEAVLAAMPGIFPFFMNWVPEFVAGEVGKRLLVRLAGKHLPPAEAEALALGLPGNVVTEMNLAVGDLADAARPSPALVAWFEQLGEDGRSWLAHAAKLEGAEPFMAAWAAFMAKYGARGPSEIDIMMPRWHEEPLPVLQVVANALKQEPGSHWVQHEKLARERETAVAHLLDAAGRGLLGGLRRRLFERLIHVATEVGGMREHHKFVAVRFLGIVKQILLQNADLLVAQGKLASLDDIWYLPWKEVLAIWDDADIDWQARIQQRRADLERFQKLTPPLIITSDGETPAVQYELADAPEGALLGSPVSPGVVEGIVHVVHDPQTETLAPGEILVAPYTDPGWTPLFINAAGLIMEVGGKLTHGSVVAREYGIPAVVGVRGATQRLHTGQRVRVDGSRGVVEVV